MTVHKSLCHEKICQLILLGFFAGIFLICLLLPLPVKAEETSVYEVLIEDDAQLLSASEEKDLRAIMTELSVYGNVAFKSIQHNPGSTSSYISNYYYNTFGSQSGTVFLIDMDNRYLWIYSDGAMYEVITDSYADTITDNVYRYASSGDYYKCASEVFRQELSLLKGQRISQPMKYICNGLLAVTLALLLNYFIVLFLSRSRKPSRDELMANIKNYCLFDGARANFVNQTRKYSPQSSGSSGGHSGGGGGHHSGGGGGHRF